MKDESAVRTLYMTDCRAACDVELTAKKLESSCRGCLIWGSHCIAKLFASSAERPDLGRSFTIYHHEGNVLYRVKCKDRTHIEIQGF